MKQETYLVWFAGDHLDDGEHVTAASVEEAAQRAACALLDPADPLDVMELFVRPQVGATQRFRVLVDMTRWRYDETIGAMVAESAVFTPSRIKSPCDVENALSIDVGSLDAEKETEAEVMDPQPA